jgi:hypothetical protein
MDNIESTMDALRGLARKHGSVLSLSLVFKTLFKSGIYRSREALADCLRALQKEKKIKSINFGIDIELLENIDSNAMEYTQSSLSGYGIKKMV